MASFELKSSRFRLEREDSWRELETLIQRIESKGLRKLNADELSRLPTLYRSAVSSLSVARAISLDRNLLEYLESLVARAYIAVYAVKRPLREVVASFFSVDFPQVVRRYSLQLLLAVTAMVVGALAGHMLTDHDQERFYSLVPSQMAQGRTPAATTDELRATLYRDGDADEDDELDVSGTLQAFAASLFAHNSQVGILCFALGFVFGAPTIFLMFYNGLMLGSMASVFANRGLGLDFWGWILPHGITELLAISIFGMAGLAVGSALVFPGEQGRLEHLASRGREVMPAVIGGIVMLFLAAVIEGFFRQLVDDMWIRYGLAAATAVFWCWYLIFVGRTDHGRG